MDRYTFGSSKAAQNLINILQEPRYNQYSKRVARLLSKQSTILKEINTIHNKTIREATLKMWHEHFVVLCSSLPEIVRTHTLCVETAWYRQLLRKIKIKFQTR